MINVEEIGMVVAVAGGVSAAFGYIVNDVIDVWHDIKEQEKDTARLRAIHNRDMATLERESWCNPGDAAEYDGESCIIIGEGLNDTVTILIEGKVCDVTINRLRKVVVL